MILIDSNKSQKSVRGITTAPVNLGYKVDKPHASVASPTLTLLNRNVAMLPLLLGNINMQCDSTNSDELILKGLLKIKITADLVEMKMLILSN